MKGRYIFYVLILTYLTSLTVAAGGIQPVILPSTASTSPLNPYPYGLYNFYSDLTSLYDVGFISTPFDIALEGDRILYVVIGPEQSFSEAEAGYIADLLNSGRIDLLLSDETNISNSILTELGIEVDGRIMVLKDVFDESRYISRIDCGSLGGGFISKSSYVSVIPPESEVLCRGDGIFIVDGEVISNPPIAVRIILDSGSEILVIADSSICTNFMYSSSWWNIEGNKGLCMEFVNLLLGDDYDTIIFDIGHYIGSQLMIPIITDYIIKSIIILQVIIGFVLNIMGPFLYPFIVFASLLVIGTYIDVFRVGYIKVSDPTLEAMVSRIIKEYTHRFNSVELFLGLNIKWFRRFLIDKVISEIK